MSCNIVKQWVGSKDNEYDYCRTHKVESKDCPKEEPQIKLELVRDIFPSTAPSACMHKDTTYWSMIDGSVVMSCFNCGRILP